MIDLNQLPNPNEPKKEAHFVRVQADMYKEVERIAKEQGRTIQMQTQILLGAALNRNLVHPEEMLNNAKPRTKK